MHPYRTIHPRLKAVVLPLAAALLIAVALALAAVAPASAVTTAKWTIMVYGDGDNNLEAYLPSDIDNEFSPAGSNADVSIVVLADRIPGYSNADGDWTGTKVFYCTPGMKATAANAVADWGERNMGDPQTLKDFITWTKANYPATHYVLEMWDHGYTWWPEYVMWDETSQDGLTLPEMATAMSGQTVDVVAWDCCSMSAVEVAASWRPLAQYATGSEELTGAEGIAWEKVIPAVRATPTMDAATMATTIGKNMNDGTTSVLALDARWDALRTATDQLAVSLTVGLPTYRASYDAALKVTKYFAADRTLVDLWSAASNLKAKVADPVIKARCDAVMGAVKSCVVYESHKAKYAGANGITVFWPKTQADLTATDWGAFNGWTFYRAALPWSAQTGWDEFLAAYVK